MPEASIPRQPQLAPALDWSALRAEGLTHIQRLSGLVWTDHNLHDPGITSLEVLCYALTDLAYRTRFATVDLMTAPDGRMDPAEYSGLAPAHEVLPCTPLTLADWRRLLLRIEGVRNAWLDPMQDPADSGNYRRSEVALYADCSAGRLSFNPQREGGQANHPVRLSGLYRVLVELEIDDLLGSLNEAALVYRVRRGALKGLVLAFDSQHPQLLDGSLDLARTPASVEVLELSSVAGGFDARLRLHFDSGPVQLLQPCSLRLIEERPRPDHPALEVTEAAIKELLEQCSAADDLLPLFWRKQDERAHALQRVRCVLHAHRALCEDFLSVATVTPWRIGVCADIEVRPDADLEAVQAQVCHAIERYLSPPVHYRTLEDMLASGLQPDQIFNGPWVDFSFACDGQPVFTRPGFITDTDLAASEPRRQVHASDIINLVVDIEGVEAISNLQLRLYGADGRPAAAAEKWTLQVPAGHQPVFYMERSKLLFHKAGIPYRAQLTEFRRTLDHLRALDRRELYVAPDQILPVPLGRWRNLDTFYSVQHDFPATYMSGRAGISPEQPVERIARARQFKGYLTFFDQLLADYLGQLAGLRRLYSLDRTLDRSWFSQPLSGIAGSLGSFDDEFWIDSSLPDALTLTRLSESEEAFTERRNRVLDHLLARFAERFADYALLSFRLSGDRLQTGAQLIADKIDFLSEYPQLSRQRGQACNLEPEDPAQVWDSASISGLERRAGRLLGIDDLSRRDLHCAGHFAALFASVEDSGQFHLLITAGDEAEALFRSTQALADEDAVTALAQSVWPGLRSDSAFAVDEGPGGVQLQILCGSQPLTHASTFATAADAWERARAIIARYDALLEADACNSEGMHLIEHILLRPRAAGDALLGVCLPEGCEFCGEEDPYSFRVSVVLPYWPERFRNLHFRALLERTLREEAPAHVQLKICWVSLQHMRALDQAWHAWLDARAARPQDALQLRQCSARLIQVLESLRTVYPAAALHDCDAGEDQPIVRLGSTALGIF